MKESNLYNRNEIWNNPLEGYQKNVLRNIKNVLPNDISNVLDIGCGDGFITNNLPENLFVVGLDIGKSPLNYVRTFKTIASSSSIPFKSKSFDVVMANDTLEHYPKCLYSNALLEIARVANKYVIITVPFMENLKTQETFCSECGSLYHINHHERAFGVPELINLLEPDWRPTKFLFTGTELSGREIAFSELKAIKGIPAFWEKAICPNCNMPSKKYPVNELVSEFLDLYDNYFSYHLPDRNEWIVLYEKNNSDRKSKEFIPMKIGNYFNNDLVGCKLLLNKNGALLNPEKYIPSNSAIYVEYTNGGVSYVYCSPERTHNGLYKLPYWYMPNMVSKLSPNVMINESLRVQSFVDKSLFDQNTNLKTEIIYLKKLFFK